MPALLDTERSFGFEAEFATNGSVLAKEVRNQGLWDGENLHDWHCCCEICDCAVVKVQYDSTASGEAISRPFYEGVDEALDVFQRLQEAAVLADAEPGTGQGVHVHVSLPPRGYRAKGFAAFALIESEICQLGAGRFRNNRGWNREVTRPYGDLTSYYSDSAMMQDWYQNHRDSDRHSNLNLNTGYDTWEYRFWNSTRSAWRIELAVRASLALSDPAFIEATLAQYEAVPSEPMNVQGLLTDWDSGGRLSELLTRQVSYLDKLEGNPPPLKQVLSDISVPSETPEQPEHPRHTDSPGPVCDNGPQDGAVGSHLQPCLCPGCGYNSEHREQHDPEVQQYWASRLNYSKGPF